MKKQRKKYGIDERASPELKGKLSRYLDKAADPERLTPFLHRRFELSGDFFSLREKPLPGKSRANPLEEPYSGS